MLNLKNWLNYNSSWVVEFYLKEFVSTASQGLESLLCNLAQKLLRVDLISQIEPQYIIK